MEVSALAITFKAQYSYEQTYTHCELTVIVLGVDRDQAVS
jgi:hypothetical protein